MSREKRDRLEQLQGEVGALERELADVEALIPAATVDAREAGGRRRTATAAYDRVRAENERLLLTAEHRKAPVGDTVRAYVKDYDPFTAPWYRGIVGVVVLGAGYYLFSLLRSLWEQMTR